jgi:hypothetical protein
MRSLTSSSVSRDQSTDSSGVGPILAHPVERRASTRIPVRGTVWLVDAAGQAVTRAESGDVSDEGARMSVPLGYGFAEGQNYELRVNGPGTRPAAFGLRTSRWAEVVRTRITFNKPEGELELGLRFTPQA